MLVLRSNYSLLKKKLISEVCYKQQKVEKCCSENGGRTDNLTYRFQLDVYFDKETTFFTYYVFEFN